MTRREAVRVLLFVRGALQGADRSVRCALADLSAGGARLTFSGEPPVPPLRLEFDLAGEHFRLPVEIHRVVAPEGAVVAFQRPYSERLYRALAAEQRRALAQGRANISERRLAPPGDSGSPEAERRDR